MVPTERARALAAPLARILGDIDALVQPAAFDPAALDTVFKIGITDNAFSAVALPFIQKIQTLAPNVKTAFFSLQHAQMEERLAQGALDAAIAARVAAPERLHHKVLYREHFVCAMRQDHPVLAEDWNIDTFCAQNFVLGSFFGGGFSGAVDEALAQQGRSRRVAVSVQGFAQIPAILRHKAGCSPSYPRIWCNTTPPLPYAICPSPRAATTNSCSGTSAPTPTPRNNGCAACWAG